MLKGAAYTDIARELELHAVEELQHAIKIAKQIDYLGDRPGVTPKPVKTCCDAVGMLCADLENEGKRSSVIANASGRLRQWANLR
jgi:bacterioferritin